MAAVLDHSIKFDLRTYIIDVTSKQEEFHENTLIDRASWDRVVNRDDVHDKKIIKANCYVGEWEKNESLTTIKVNTDMMITF